MPPVIVIAADVLVALCPLLLMRVGEADLRKRAGALLALPFANVALLLIFVFSEDSYRRNGISRWDAYRSPGGLLSRCSLRLSG